MSSENTFLKRLYCLLCGRKKGEILTPRQSEPVAGNYKLPIDLKFLDFFS